MKTLIAWLTAVASAGLITACGGGSDGTTSPTTPPPGAATGSIAGSVVAADSNTPLAAVQLSAAGQSASTAADGSFTLNSVGTGERVVLRAQKAGYLDGFRVVTVAANAATSSALRLQPASPAQTVDSASAATVTAPNSAAQVQLPAASLVTGNGTPVTGNAQVSVTPIDPATDPAAMPGNYTALNAGTVSRIESFGAIKVDLRDSTGARLNLAAGKTATIRIPLATRSPNPPATVPLFYFDEQTGHWVQEGSATLVAGARPYYEGQVGHFTYWNADQVTQTVIIDGCVNDSTGAPATGVTVHSDGVDYSGDSETQSDAQGRFSVFARSSSTVSVYGERNARFTNVATLQTTAANSTLGTCLVVPAGVSPLMAPIIVAQPKNTATTAGVPAFLNVTAIGSQPMTYEWRRNGVAIANSNNRTLLIAAPTLADDGSVYSVKVSNAAGEATSDDAVLTITGQVPLPTLVSNPASVTVTRGASASFSVVAVSSASLGYQWRRNGVDIAGATASSYSLATTTLADSGSRFSVLVSNSSGGVTSAEATLTVLEPTHAPSIVADPKDQAAEVGDDVTFSVNAIGDGALSYQWQRNGSDIAGATQASLVLGVDAADDGALYRAVVRNANGSATSATATLRVAQGDPVSKQRLMNLSQLWSIAQQGTAAALQLSDPDGTLYNPLCSSGSATATLDGAAAAGGTVLPVGSHTLAATLDHCVQISTAVLNGSSSVAYTYLDATHRKGSYSASATNVRLLYMNGGNTESDSLINGSSQATLDGSVSGNAETADSTYTPVAGLSVLSQTSGLTAQFTGGSVTTHIVTLDARLPAQRVQQMRVTYTQLRLTIAGVAYLLDGSYQIDFAPDGLSITGSGVVSISADGNAIGRLLVSSTAGLLADVRGTVPALGLRGGTVQSRSATARRLSPGASLLQRAR